MTYLFCYRYKQGKLPNTIQVYFQLYREKYNERDGEIASCIVKKEYFTPQDMGGLVKLVSIDYPRGIFLDSIRVEIKNAENKFSFFHVPRDNIQEAIKIRKEL